MSDTPPAAAPPPAAGRSAPWLRWAVLAGVTIVAMLAGAGGATAVTLLIVRDEQPQTARQYEVQVFLDVAATAEQKAAVESDLSARYPAGAIRLQTREEAYENFKQVYKDDPDLLRSVEPSSLPESFVVTTTATGFDCAALSPVERMDGVDEATVRRLDDSGRPDALILGCP
ncbi:permease-like cell division protein FtsX [Micromonospora sp. CPCC 205371]|nr:permease-like cell division protein FtsX [Micromonospora sp. CPCC 205371]